MDTTNTKHEYHMFSKIYKNKTEFVSLLGIIHKFTYNLSDNVNKRIIHMIKSGKTDKIISQYIAKNINSKKTMGSGSRAKRISDTIHYFFISSAPYKPFFKIGKYLDIGSNSGTITVELGNKLRIISENIYGVDVQDFDSTKIIPVAGFNFAYYDGLTLPFMDFTFELVSCFMVLHHVEHIDKMLREISRVMKPGGYLLLKEHDVYNMYIEWKVYIEHLLYSIKDNNTPYDKFVATYYQKTYSVRELEELLDKHNFRQIAVSDKTFLNRYHKFNPNNTYYSLYEKK